MELQEIFSMQSELNDYVFNKQGIKTEDGEPLTSNYLLEQGKKELVTPNSDTNKWLRKYLEALNDESRELSDELPFKWWAKDNLNMQNIRVEIIDQLHFWVSEAITAGMGAEDVERIYKQKHTKNITRQDNEYSSANKTEDDNLDII